MKTKLIQKIKEETSQEPKCIFDHSNTLQLVSVHQDDGTWYRYCYHCKWIDVKEIVSQSKEELVEEIKKILKVEMCPQIVGICSRHETHDIEILLKRLLEDLNKK